MGIFADFLAERPMRIPEEREGWREFEALLDQGDSEAPSGFEGRTGWAVLKTLGMTNQVLPPAVGYLLGYVKQDLDYGQFPISPGTARIIANQTAIEDGVPGLEQDLLIHLDLCHSEPDEICLNAPAIQVMWPDTGSIELTADDYVHRWSADEQVMMVDGDLVNEVSNGGSDSLNILSASSLEGTFKENILNGLPIFRYSDSDSFLGSANDVTLFPAKRGTYVWLGVLNEDFDFSIKFLSLINPSSAGLVVTDDGITAGAVQTSNSIDGDVVLEVGPPKELEIGVPHLMIMIRDSDTSMRFRRNGVEKDGATVSDYNPVTAQFKCGNAFGPGSFSINHDLALILLYDRVLSSGEIITLESELITAYGVS